MSDSGLDSEGDKCLNSLIEAWNAFVKIPIDHPDELTDFRRSIHECQRILAMKIARNQHPEAWPCYPVFWVKKDGK